MADKQLVVILRQGSDAWNAWWYGQKSAVRLDLTNAELSGAELVGAELSGADFSGANLTSATLMSAELSGAKLVGANLSGAKLTQAVLMSADLSGADLRGAQLIGANLSWARLLDANLSGARLIVANLSWARLAGADLRGANLRGVNLVRADLTRANLTGCHVYGISAWDLKLEGAEQKDLVITQDGPEITVDNLEVAQFIYLLLHNEKIRDVLDTITSKVVLILGRFTDERKAVLDALREELRKRDYLPVLFDFGKQASRSTLETISTLAHMARFVIADLTDAKSVLQELQAVVPPNPSVPVQPLILATQEEPGMFDFFRLYPWMLEPYRYPDPMGLLATLTERVIAPAERVLSKS